MSSRKGRIVGEVALRDGDGMARAIPQGPCEIDLTHVDATVSWTEGDTRGVTALPIAEYTRYVTEGAIALES